MLPTNFLTSALISNHSPFMVKFKFKQCTYMSPIQMAQTSLWHIICAVTNSQEKHNAWRSSGAMQDYIVAAHPFQIHKAA